MTKTPKPYSESKDHVPNPMYQSGVVDTTGTTGDMGARLENVSPIFEQARADALGNAVDALDNDPDAASDHVVFPDDDKTRDDAEKDLRRAAKDAVKSDQLKTGRSEAELEAAEKGEPGNQSEASAANKAHSGGRRETDERKAPGSGSGKSSSGGGSSSSGSTRSSSTSSSSGPRTTTGPTGPVTGG